MIAALPVLKVDDMPQAKQFFETALGFEEIFRNQPTEQPNPAYIGLRNGDALLHLSSFSGDGVSGAVVNLYVADIDALYDKLKAAEVNVPLPPVDQSWGVREMHVTDPSGNKLRFCQVSG